VGICKHNEHSESDIDDVPYANAAASCVYFVSLLLLAWKARLRGHGTQINFYYGLNSSRRYDLVDWLTTCWAGHTGILDKRVYEYCADCKGHEP